MVLLFNLNSYYMNTNPNPIGVIHSPYRTKEAAPIQGIFSPGDLGRVEVFPEYAEGLKDIETFSHIILLYRFDRAGEIKLVRPTFLDDEPPRNICLQASLPSQRPGFDHSETLAAFTECPGDQRDRRPGRNPPDRYQTLYSTI